MTLFRYGRLLAIVFCVTPAWAIAQPAGSSRGEAMAWNVIDDVVRIQVTAADGSAGEQGFGFVVGERSDHLYIVTADHVVRADGDPRGAVTVTFHTDQGHALPASLLDLQKSQKDGDLAVLELAAPPRYVPRWPAKATEDSLESGTKAWRIGKRGEWLPPTTPGEFAGEDGMWLMFDALDTPPGSSGGPVVTEDGVIGMVVADGGNFGLPSRVLPIGVIYRQMKIWQIPWNLSRPDTALPPLQAALSRPNLQPPPPAAAPPAAEGALEDDVRAFAVRYYASMSNDNSDVLASLPGLVTDPITFYGQRTSRTEYMRQAYHYLQRWPVRQFVLRPESVTVQCDVDASCRVTGVIDFVCRDPASGRHSSGIEHIMLLVRRAEAGLQIVEEGLPS